MLLSDLFDVPVMCERYASGVTRQAVTIGIGSGHPPAQERWVGLGRRRAVEDVTTSTLVPPFRVANTEEKKEEKTFHVTGE